MIGSWPGPAASPLPATAGGLASLTVYASMVDLVVLLTSKGLSPGLAAWGLRLGGARQGTGCLSYPVLARRTTARRRPVADIALLATTLGALAIVPRLATLVIGIAILGGAACGLFTLVVATTVADHWAPPDMPPSLGYTTHPSPPGSSPSPLALIGAAAPLRWKHELAGSG